MNVIKHFQEDSNPVLDMSIGVDRIIKDWVENEIKYKDDYKERDLLWICAEGGKIKFIKYLIDTSYNIHLLDDYAICCASKNEHIEIVKLLLDAGADVHVRDDYSLYYASHNGHTEIVKLLLNAGADACICKALYYALCENHIEIIRILQDHMENEKP